MLKFVMPGSVPPGNKFFYTIPETGTFLESYSWYSFAPAVATAYRVAGLQPPPNLELVIQDYMCRRLPDKFCTGSLDGKPRAKVVTYSDIKLKSKQWAISDPSAKASQPVALKRAKGCADCPMHDRAGCTSCTGLNKWALQLVKVAMHGSINDWIGVCAIDSVLALTKIFTTRTVLEVDTLLKEGYPETCWRVTELQRSIKNAPVELPTDKEEEILEDA